MSLYESLSRVLAPFASRLNGLLTGYDGTTYSSPAEAVRTQISDLHVLIGDIQGDAKIAGSAVGYDGTESGLSATTMQGAVDEVSGDVANVNGRLDDLGIPSSIREAIYNLFDAAGYTETTNVSVSLAVLEAWAEETTSLSINQSTLSLVSRGATAQLTATVVPSGNTVTWTSSDTSVATVSSAGLVTAVGIGTAVITATSGNISKTCLVTASWTIQNTTASILQSGAYYYDVGNTHAVREAENAAITVLYDLDAATTALSLSGVIVNDGIITSTSIGTLRVYKDGESVTYWGMYGRWAKEPADSYTEYSKATTVSEFNQISFTVDSRYLDDSYMYDGVTGQVYFAGVNTPYYGMSNISEAS